MAKSVKPSPREIARIRARRSELDSVHRRLGAMRARHMKEEGAAAQAAHKALTAYEAEVNEIAKARGLDVDSGRWGFDVEAHVFKRVK